jgi:hypothetical protein
MHWMVSSAPSTAFVHAHIDGRHVDVSRVALVSSRLIHYARTLAEPASSVAVDECTTTVNRSRA